MKIGIDIRNLSKPLTGIGRYTFELCNELSILPNSNLFLYSPAPLVKGICFKNIENHRVRVFNKKSLFLRQLWAETTLPKCVSSDNVDIFWGPAHRLPFCLSKKIPSVVTIHDLVFKYYPRTMRLGTRILDEIQMPLAVKQADHICTVSIATKSSVIKEFGCSESRVSVVYNGVYPKENTKPLPLANFQVNYILFVGTLEPRKNLAKLLKAYSLLDSNVKDSTHLVIAGGKGWGDVQLETVIEDLALKPYVHLMGYVDEETLQSLYANALFLAMPSLYEGFGLPIIEAMSYGVPVLTSNNSSMPEVAGEAGYLVDPFDAQSLQNGLFQMITNHALRDSLAKKAKANTARFTWKQSALQLRNIFENIASQR